MAEPRFDDLDLRIIDALAEDGRRPYTSVADELGVAEATIRSRVARLQRIEAIRFVTDVKPHELGLLFAYLGVRIGGRDVRRSIDAICRIPEAVYVIECTGQYDVLVEIVAQDGDDLLRVMQEEIRKVPDVTEVDSFVGCGSPRAPSATPTWAERASRGLRGNSGVGVAGGRPEGWSAVVLTGPTPDDESRGLGALAQRWHRAFVHHGDIVVARRAERLAGYQQHGRGDRLVALLDRVGGPPGRERDQDLTHVAELAAAGGDHAGTDHHRGVDRRGHRTPEHGERGRDRDAELAAPAPRGCRPGSGETSDGFVGAAAPLLDRFGVPHEQRQGWSHGASPFLDMAPGIGTLDLRAVGPTDPEKRKGRDACVAASSSLVGGATTTLRSTGTRVNRMRASPQPRHIGCAVGCAA